VVNLRDALLDIERVVKEPKLDEVAVPEFGDWDTADIIKFGCILEYHTM
jgi:hypothetical protein